MSQQIELLQQLGLSKKEAKLYLTALEYGPTTIMRLAQKCGVKRATLYGYLGDMLARGILQVTVSGKRKLYSGAEPEKLGKLLERQKEALDALIPELSIMVAKSPQRPKIRLYEGLEGLQYIYDDSLDHPEGSELLSFADLSEIYSVFSDTFMDQWIKKKKRKKISSRIIWPSDEHSEEHMAENKEELRESIVVSKKEFHFPNQISVCGHKTYIMSFGDERMGVIMESQQTADTQRAIFNMLWNALKDKKVKK